MDSLLSTSRQFDCFVWRQSFTLSSKPVLEITVGYWTLPNQNSKCQTNFTICSNMVSKHKWAIAFDSKNITENINAVWNILFCCRRLSQFEDIHKRQCNLKSPCDALHSAKLLTVLFTIVLFMVQIVSQEKSKMADVKVRKDICPSKWEMSEIVILAVWFSYMIFIYSYS